MKRPPILAVWKFASCDGCQLTLLDCEDELRDIAGQYRIAHFSEASSDLGDGRFDVSLVEGSVSTAAGEREIRDIRHRSDVLVAIGACATAGGIQALRNFSDSDEFISTVYAQPGYIDTLATATPASAHVHVDYELQGCPIDRGQLLEVLNSVLAGRKPRIPSEPVCTECKRRNITCVTVASGTPCLGPVTRAGCGALCPSFGRGCYGCFGPADRPRVPVLIPLLRKTGMTGTDIDRTFATFNAAAPGFADRPRP